jgi:hypothetical protein
MHELKLMDKILTDFETYFRTFAETGLRDLMLLIHELTLKRIASRPDGTFGVLLAEDVPFALTLDGPQRIPCRHDRRSGLRRPGPDHRDERAKLGL